MISLKSAFIRNSLIMIDSDRLDRLHEILKDPVRQKILLKLGEREKLSFDELMKELKIDDQRELYDELRVLSDLVTKVKDDPYPLPKENVSETLSEQYMLTEEGHDALDEMIASPELESDDYKEKMFDKDGQPKPNFVTSHRFALAFLTVAIVGGIIIFLLISHFHIKGPFWAP